MRVLVLESDPSTRDFFKMCLEHLGHQTLLSADAGSVFRAAQEARFDVLLADVQPRDHGCWELIEQLRHGGWLPSRVVSMSVSSCQQTVALSENAGCFAHLVKPFRIAELQAALCSGIIPL